MFVSIYTNAGRGKVLLIKKPQLFPLIFSTTVQFWTLVELFQGCATSGLAEFHHNTIGLISMVVAEI